MNNREYGLGFISFLAGLFFAIAWILIVMLIAQQNFFSTAQVIGACINFALVAVALTCWGYLQKLPAKRIISRISLGLSLAIGTVFTAVSAPFDETGLWGVGLIFIVIGSLAGSALITALTLAILRIPLPRK
ncbi:transporter [Corynebacterium crudilactis]|uniref:Transporter n=1 Tax=Corynebacterium crudilactis TaxID=1652495 RepID=A0A172QQ78_9CORY|nr:transporter [Corynebacterium crudilactis]ANE02828.1 transporter [Corynebacterium crudilactis]